MTVDSSTVGTFALGIPGLAVAFLVFNVVLILMLAFAVAKDAEERKRTSSGLFLIGPWMWFFVVLGAGGYLPTFAYWFIHYSAQRYRRDSHPHPSPPPPFTG